MNHFLHLLVLNPKNVNKSLARAAAIKGRFVNKLPIKSYSLHFNVFSLPYHNPPFFLRNVHDTSISFKHVKYSPGSRNVGVTLALTVIF